jgi:uncharacterized protein (TIGR02246 family)
MKQEGPLPMQAQTKERLMTTGGTTASNEVLIQLTDSWVKGVRAKDLDAVMSHYAPDVLLFDLVPPLQYAGGDAYRKNWAEWFATWRGHIGYEIQNLSIIAGDDVAFRHSLNRISGTRTSGEETDVWVRMTACYRQINGKWLIMHEHVSVPFYMDGSYKAAVDLKP